MFPYPSGAGLHVGHPLGYIATDVYARFLRMTGHHVLHPFGYDAFGLPAEQYAINTGQHPRGHHRAPTSPTMRAPAQAAGPGPRCAPRDRDHRPSFYRWTQWIFLQIFDSWFDDEPAGPGRSASWSPSSRRGRAQPPGGRSWAELAEPERRDLLDGYRLAYLSEELVNWCPGLGTVLANEEVTADGRSDVGNYPVFRRPLRQWMLRITAYADRLIGDLDLVDWPEPVKHMQRNWIGASEGASDRLRRRRRRPGGHDRRVHHPPGHPARRHLPGAGARASADRRADRARLARRDPGQLAVPGGRRRRMPRRRRSPPTRRAAGQRAERRHGRTVDKTGVFTGSYVINPATGEQIPVFVADYVLMGYGTGAIMAVPAHDQRDLEFARAFGLPVRAVLQPPDEWSGRARSRPEPRPANGPRRSPATGGTRRRPGRRWPAWAGTPRSRRPSAGWSGTARAAGHAATGCGTGCSPGSATGASRSRSSTTSTGAARAAREHAAGAAAGDDRLPARTAMADGRRRVATRSRRWPGCPAGRTVTLDLGDGPRAYRRELEHHAAVGRVVLVLPALPGPRPTTTAFVDPEVERYWMVPRGPARRRRPVRRRRGARGAPPAVRPVLAQGAVRPGPRLDAGAVRRLLNQGYILADAFTDARGMYVPAAEVSPGRRRRLRHRGAGRSPGAPGRWARA